MIGGFGTDVAAITGCGRGCRRTGRRAVLVVVLLVVDGVVAAAMVLVAAAAGAEGNVSVVVPVA
jgi:hypothetical protein